MREPVSSWRDVFANLRDPGLRLPTLFALIMSAAGYMLCFAVAFAFATAAYELAVVPTLTALAGFAHGHVSTAARVLAGMAAGGVVGAPLFAVCVKLMYRLAGRG